MTRVAKTRGGSPSARIAVKELRVSKGYIRGI